MVHKTVIQLDYPPPFKGELQLMGLIASESLGQFLFSPPNPNVLCFIWAIIGFW